MQRSRSRGVSLLCLLGGLAKFTKCEPLQVRTGRCTNLHLRPLGTAIRDEMDTSFLSTLLAGVSLIPKSGIVSPIGRYAIFFMHPLLPLSPAAG